MNVDIEKLKEIGNYLDFANLVDIKRKFFENKLLLVTSLAYYSNNLSDKTKIKCPFCENGVLMLIKKKKDICKVHVCHTGDSYTFVCSERCNHVRYIYTNQWLYC